MTTAKSARVGSIRPASGGNILPDSNIIVARKFAEDEAELIWLSPGSHSNFFPKVTSCFDRQLPSMYNRLRCLVTIAQSASSAWTYSLLRRFGAITSMMAPHLWRLYRATDIHQFPSAADVVLLANRSLVIDAQCNVS